MFYLKELFSFTRSNLIVSFLFLTLSILCLWSVQNRTWIKSVFSPQSTSGERNYFTAVLSDKADIVSIKRKMENLPGVSFAKINEITDIQSQLSDTLVGVNLDEYQDILNHKYFSIKVFLKNNVSGTTLILEYLKRLAGSAKISMSSLKTIAIPSRMMKGVSNLAKSLGDKVVIGIGLTFWLFLGIFYFRRLGAHLAVLQFYQRRKNLTHKMGLLFGALFSVGALAYGALNSAQNTYYITVLSMSFTIMLIGAVIQKGGVNARKA